MNNMTPKEILVPTVILTTICIIITGLLAVTNELTKEPIAKQVEMKAQLTREIVLPQATTYKELDINTLGKDLDIDNCYAGYDENETLVGYTVTATKNGYGGPIQVMIGILNGENSVNGVSILSQTETPGLGANATQSEFTDQYKQEAPERFNVVKTPDVKTAEIEAITGSTITSQAVTDAVNNALKVYNSTLKDKELSEDKFLKQ